MLLYTDKEEFFVPAPSYFEVVYLSPDKPAVIPCRVTNPSAKVTLHQEFPAEEIKVDGTNIIYDAKKGFIYQYPTSDQKGVVYCKAESRGTSQISIKYQLLYVEGKLIPRDLCAVEYFQCYSVEAVRSHTLAMFS